MEFKLDENLPVELVEVLRTGGHGAVTVLDQGLGGARDTDIADVCRREGKALITLDVGFADIRAYPPEQYPGIVVLRLMRHDKRHVLDVLQRVVPKFETEELASRLWIVEEGRVRIRE